MPLVTACISLSMVRTRTSVFVGDGGTVFDWGAGVGATLLFCGNVAGFSSSIILGSIALRLSLDRIPLWTSVYVIKNRLGFPRRFFYFYNPLRLSPTLPSSSRIIFAWTVSPSLTTSSTLFT